MKTASLFAAFLSIPVLSPAGEASFATKPVASKAGDKVTVRFAVNAPTDVEVAVLDSAGKVVRHLAAGVLGGEKPPPEPLKAGLSQSIEWDMKDDAGKPAAGGPFKFRVRAGMRAELDGFPVEKPIWVGELGGLAVGANGDLYVYSSAVWEHYGSSRCLQIYSREGKYLRTIMPPPANLPKEKLLPFNKNRRGTLDIPGKEFMPRNYQSTWPEFYSERVGSLAPRLTNEGSMMISFYGALARVNSDGSAVGEEFWRTFWRDAIPSPYTATRSFAVPSPDGKCAYVIGLSSTADSSGRATDRFPKGRIYRTNVAGNGLLEKFADVAGGRDSFHGDPLVGADCDKDGNLLVCDWGGNKVRVFSPEGKEIDGFSVECPEYVAYHRKTGAVYVLSNSNVQRTSVNRKLIKYVSWKADARKLAEADMPLRATYNHAQMGESIFMALDESSEPPAVWLGQAFWFVGTNTSRRKDCGVLRFDEQGNSFVQKLDLLDAQRYPPAAMPRMAVHPETDVLVYNDGASGIGASNGLTGEKVKLPFAYGTDVNVGLDGNWYVQTGEGYSGPICRYDKDFKPIPVPGADPKTPNAVVPNVYGRMGAGYCSVGLAADPRGRCYSMQMFDWSKYCVAVFGPDGKAEDPGRLKEDPAMKKHRHFHSAIIGPMQTKAGGVQLDYQGNIYVGLGAVPQDHKPPAGFEKDQAYNVCVGSVVKFKPEGGALLLVTDEGGTEAQGKSGLALKACTHTAGLVKPAFAENGLAVYPDLGCMAGMGGSCICRQPMFQVDGYGRIFYPNAITCSVRVVDNSGNVIMKFGQYGNIDSRGPGADSQIKKPEVPLAWPQAVGVSQKAIYVSDVANRRIMRLMKRYAAEETVALP